MQPVFFPADVRQDISVFGVRMGLLWIPALGLFAGFILFVYLPPGFPVLPRFLILVVPPLALFFFLAARVDVLWKKFRAYRKEPALRLPDARGGQRSFQSLVSASTVEDSFILNFDDGSKGTVLSIIPIPWEVMTEGDQMSAVAAFGSALTRASMAGAEVTVYLDVDADLPRAEWDRQEARWRRSFPEGSGLRKLAEARLAHFRTSVRPRPEASIRIKWRPYDASLPRKPRDEAEREVLARRAVADLVSGFAAELERSGARVRVLGAESVRDLAARQVHPLDWRKLVPVTGTDWLDTPTGSSGKKGSAIGIKKSFVSRFRRGGASRGRVEEKAAAPQVQVKVIAVAAMSEAGRKEAARTALKVAEREGLPLVDADPQGFLARETGIGEDTAGRFDWRFNPDSGGITLPGGLRFWPLSGRLFGVGDYSGNLREILEGAGSAVVNLGTGTLPEGIIPEAVIAVVTSEQDLEVIHRVFPPGRAGKLMAAVPGGEGRLVEAARKLGVQVFQLSTVTFHGQQYSRGAIQSR